MAHGPTMLIIDPLVVFLSVLCGQKKSRRVFRTDREAREAWARVRSGYCGVEEETMGHVPPSCSLKDLPAPCAAYRGARASLRLRTAKCV
jgi:hypothetical protein